MRTKIYGKLIIATHFVDDLKNQCSIGKASFSRCAETKVGTVVNQRGKIKHCILVVVAGSTIWVTLGQFI